ncbi:dihydrodipicolinate synthase family protein [Luteimicrobium album]|uniref:dihydrodipicolinate synthase family protein n=1 Tax=Luteimicrobium album TaxID=1054550 RepID=UPI003D67138E
MPRFDHAGLTIGVEERDLGLPGPWTRPTTPIRSRAALAAAHVVPLPGADNTPGGRPHVDWDATLAFRHELWSYGLGVADAMDTAQRGMGLDWETTRELVRRSAAEARTVGGRIACGAGTDQLDLASVPEGRAGLQAVVDAYREQVETVQAAGAQVIVMASRALARVASGPEDYQWVYDAVLAEVAEPAVLHWLGTMFDPALEGYWGTHDVLGATDVFVDLVRSHQDKVDGVKVSLLDADHEVALRARLAALDPSDGGPVRLYTGDDFHYPELVVGDARGHSDALLGIFAVIYPAASTALQALDSGETARAYEILAATQALGRHVFAAPTVYYKTGVAFVAWLNGHQPGFQLLGGLHAGRSLPHLVELFRLADTAGLLDDPELAARRMGALLEVAGGRP